MISLKLKHFTLAMSCILNGPEIFNASAIRIETCLSLARVSSLICLGGQTRVASPECTPANSTCSDTAMLSTSPSAATASISIS